jgi:hypothetical protein
VRRWAVTMTSLSSGAFSATVAEVFGSSAASDAADNQIPIIERHAAAAVRILFPPQLSRNFAQQPESKSTKVYLPFLVE